MQVPREELERKAREINDMVFGPDRKTKKPLGVFVKEQVDASAKFALEKALSMRGISATERKAFVEVLREQSDAVNLLLLGGEHKEKAAEMLKPIFGYKSAEFIDAFQSVFKQLQDELEWDRKKYVAG